MKGIDFFNSLDHMEPRCPGCNVKIIWGENTKWCDEKETQLCTECGAELR